MMPKAIFIDRDGVINKDPGGWTKYDYVTDWKEFFFIPGALEALRILKESGIRVVVISNQAGVNKGYFSREELDTVNKKMVDEIEKEGGRLEEVYYCVHTDEENCDCRKPKTALIDKAAKKYAIELKKTFFLGDTRLDVAAGKKAGAKTILLLSGKTTREEAKSWEEKPDYIFGDLLDAVKWITKKG